ncbi:hypothetical protein GCM10010401_08560 [Rarobacter faecitabidus]|uniref:Uncharacterized protein n=1 Tax=Rarobacter faecitabidus TaxID=13243 RepID=A0A542ZAU0_RARFA|nr:hypothetical protein [Rarobacter faecitabidus]TQL57457.1 hypothetical protein FB461_2193 [Rarobacter faecitabidus]
MRPLQITDLPDLVDTVIGYAVHAGTVAMVTAGRDIAIARLSPEADAIALHAAIPGITSIQILTYDPQLADNDPWTAALRNHARNHPRPPVISTTITIDGSQLRQGQENVWQERTRHPLLSKFGHTAASPTEVLARLTWRLPGENPAAPLVDDTIDVAALAGQLPPDRQATLMTNALSTLANDPDLWHAPMPIGGKEVHVPTLITELANYPAAAHQARTQLIRDRSLTRVAVDLARTSRPGHRTGIMSLAATAVLTHGTDGIGQISNRNVATWLNTLETSSPKTEALMRVAASPANPRHVLPGVTDKPHPAAAPQGSQSNIPFTPHAPGL